MFKMVIFHSYVSVYQVGYGGYKPTNRTGHHLGLRSLHISIVNGIVQLISVGVITWDINRSISG